VLAGSWVGSAAIGAHLYLDTASVSILGFDREDRMIRRWNSAPPAAR
jgi:probable phosphoglycerate mutase